MSALMARPISKKEDYSTVCVCADYRQDDGRAESQPDSRDSLCDNQKIQRRLSCKKGMDMYDQLLPFAVWMYLGGVTYTVRHMVWCAGSTGRNLADCFQSG